MKTNQTLAFLFMLTLQALFFSPAKAQDMTKETITIGLKDENAIDVIKKIEAQTNCRFYYRSAELKSLEHLYLSSEKRTVEETLKEMFQNTFFSFRQADQHILLELNKAVSFQVNGRLTDSEHAGVSLATLSLKEVKENKIIQTKLTDTGGYFQLNIKEMGDYLLLISAVGMDSLSIAFTLADKPLVQLSDLILRAKPNRLKEVSITGKKAFIEQKIDRTIVNVGALISNDGANALEVLEKSPGVSVDANGKISFKGKPGVTVLIDGKLTYLSGSQLAGYLRSIPSAMLDQIELMDTPPAKYDAAGDGGMINIKTKKSKAEGFNGTLSANYGLSHYGQTSESLNLNYRRNKMNLFANASYGLSQGFRQTELLREISDDKGDLSSVFRQNLLIKPKNNNANLKLGMDYELSPGTTWGIVFNGSFSPGSLKLPSSNYLYNSQGELDSTVLADNSGKSQFNKAGLSLNYNHEFERKGKVLSFDLDYLKYNANNREQFLNLTYLADGTLVAQQMMTSTLPSDISIYSVKADYTHPLKGSAKIETGFKSSYVNTDNEASYFNVLERISSPNYNFSNQFIYKENINAAYLNFNKTMKRFEFQAGLRIENTNAKGQQVGNVSHPDSSFVNHYTNLFPTAYLSYKLDTSGTHLLVASYGRRIGRPYYKDLNPFVQPSDKFTYTAGNPFLRPQFADYYKLAYRYRQLLSAAVFYTRISDLQNEVVRQEGNIFIDGTGNIGTATYLGTSLNVAFSPFAWWTVNSYMQVVRNQFKGQLYSTILHQSSTYFETNTSNQFSLPKGWSAELSFFYVGKRANGQAMVDPFGQVNTGIQKKFMQNKAALKFNVRDVFNTYKADGLTNFIPNVYSTFRNRFNSQAFTFGFTYSFGTAAKNNKRSSGGAETEQSRVKN